MHLKKLLSAGALLGAFLLAGGAQAQQPGLINSGTVLGNSTAAARTPTQTQVPSLFDSALCNTVGSYLVRTTTGWQCGAATTPLAINTTTGALTLGVVPIANGGTGQITAPLARAAAGLNIDVFTGRGDTFASISASDRVVGTNAAFTAPRTYQLPAANLLNPGQMLVVADFQGTVTATNTLTISRVGADTINGGTSVVINSANGSYALWSDGISKWTAQALGASLNAKTGAVVWSTNFRVISAGALSLTTGTVYADVWCYGGGGGGAGAQASTGMGQGGGGGAGAKSQISTTAAALNGLTVTLGAAGTGGAAGANNGGTGGDTSVGTLCVAKGGIGGTTTAGANSGGVGGAGGAATTGTGDVKAPGAYGGTGTGTTLTTIAPPGAAGANCDWGAGGVSTVFGANGNGASGFCAGGSGGSSFNTGPNQSGGNGAPGYVVVKEYLVN